MAERAKELIRRAQEVRDTQSAWNDQYDDLARVMIPRLLGFSESHMRGQSRVDDIYDGTPMQAARGLANAVGALTRPEGERWFFIHANEDALNDDDEAAQWMEDSENKLRNAFDNPKARMRQATGEVDLGLVVFGTAPLFIGEPRSLNRLLFKALHLRDTAIDWGEEGFLGVYRFKKLNVRQAENRFGARNLGEKAQELIRNKRMDEKLTYIQAVLPRSDRMLRARLAKNFPLAEFWIEEESKHIVEESGFQEWPFIVPRMDTSPDEDMGRSPGMIALPDSNTLQAMGETILVSGQRAADPPLFAPNDGSFSEANTFPGGISYYDVNLARQMRGNPVFPLETGHNLAISREMQADTREQVFAAFFKNVFNLPVQGPQMTATEVIQRREEFVREVGPMFSRLEADYIAPMVERSFMIMLRAGAFLPIPEVLGSQSIKFEFESPVKRVRMEIEAAAARVWKDELLQIAAVDPSVMDAINLDEYARFTAQAVKVPLKLTRTQDEIDQIRQDRAEQQQAQQDLAELEQGAGAAKDIANAIGQVSGETGSA